MKLKYQIAAVAVGVALVGCSRNDQPGSEKQPDTPVATTKAHEREKDAAAAPVTESKDEFIASMEKKLRELDAKIGELAQKAEGYTDDAKVQADQSLSALRERRHKVKEKFEEVKKASAEAWKDVKAGFASAMDELEKAFENARSKFS